jgi:hypothetical protein
MILSLPKGIPTLQTPAGNWTRLDNGWRSNTPDNPVIHCDTIPAIHPPLVDHMPIITILDLPFPRSSAAKSLDFRLAEWPAINSALKQQLEAESPTSHINSKEEFNEKVNGMVHIITAVLNEQLDKRRPNPFKRCWWTKESHPPQEVAKSPQQQVLQTLTPM